MSRTKPAPNSLEALLREQALGYPEAVEDFPWGERVTKVRGKIFLFMHASGTRLRFSVKLPHSGAEALELSFVEPSGYGLGKHGWVTATVDLTRESPLDSFRRWVEESYRAVAPKRVAALLDAPPTEPGSDSALDALGSAKLRTSAPNRKPRATSRSRAKTPATRKRKPRQR